MRIAGSALTVSLLLFAGCASTTPSKVQADDPAAPSNRDGSDAPAAVERGGAEAPAIGQDELQEDAELYSLREQKDRLLYDAAMAQARELQARMRLEEALVQAERALEIEPDSLEARRLRSEIAAMLGRDAGVIASTGADEAARLELKFDQMRLDVRRSLNDAKLALARGDYDRAIAELSLAQTNVRLSPYNVDWQGMDEEIDRLLAQADEDRVAAEEAARLEAQEQAFNALKEREEAERAREQQVVDNIVVEASLAFEAARYDRAMELADLALRQQPRHEVAQQIRDDSFRIGRERVRKDYIEAKREEFQKWRESLEELRIPWTNVMTLPDRDEWQRKTALRARRRGLDLSQRISPAETQLRNRVATTSVRMPGIEGEESLDNLMGIIRDFTGLPIIVDPAAENAVVDNSVIFDFNFENELTVEQALNRITAMAGEDVTWTVRHEAIFVTTREKAAGDPIPYVHDVQDLIFGLTDFTGPRIDRLRLLSELEDDDGGGPFGGVLETERLIEIDELVTLITDNVSTDSWENDGVLIEPGEGYVLVTQTPEVQQEIRDFLEDLRRFNAALVTIESKFMEVGDNWIQEIGVDFRGLDNRVLEDVTNGLEDMASLGLDNGGSGIDGVNAAGQPSAGFFFDDGQDGAFAATTQNFFSTALGQRLSTLGGFTFQLTFLDDSEVSAILRAVEKTSQFQIVNSQTLSVHNSQRAYVTVINQQAYIQDFDVEVAQFQAVADPQINVLHEGVVLDVRPTIHHDRKWLQLEVQPTIARVVNLRNFSTTLGGNTAPVEFQLPELEVQSVNTSAFLPDGGSLLLGGLSRLRNVERRAEVPWIANVPVLGFLFKTEGYSDERQSLMILIKATITDIRESVTEKLERRY